MDAYATNANGANDRDTRSKAVRTPVPAGQASGEFVRLSHLRKLCECKQVAAVCYRVRGDRIEFLLVRTRSTGRWTFPKGSAEPGLTHAQAAALEAFEEAGVHGRIEEAPFARYVRNKRSKAGSRTGKFSEKEVGINAHLCQVSRLSRPSESNRKRTWFSVEGARQSLLEGRKTDDGAEFARVIDRAVERIERLWSGSLVAADHLSAGHLSVDRWKDDRRQKSRLRLDRPRPDARERDVPQRDALQKVKFDFAEAYGGVEQVSSPRYIRLQTGMNQPGMNQPGMNQPGMRQSERPVAGQHPREVLPCEVLEFSPRREKKTKALGTGTKNG